MRGRQRDDFAKEPTLILSDGRRFISTGGSSNGGPPAAPRYICSEFDYVPVRDKTLHYACTVDGEQIKFTFKNPYYRNDLPVWKGVPLPQTQRNEDLALTLHALAIEPSHSYIRGTDWTAKPRWSITKGEQKADKWFAISTNYEDPSGQQVRDCGLFNEPVWKVCCAASRTNEYPFAEDEVDWLGTVGPDAPAPETYQLFAVESAKHSRLKLAGIFGPGRYTVGENGIEKVESPVSVEWTGGTKIESDFQNKTVHIAIANPVVLLIGSAFFVYRDSKGRPTRLEHNYGHGGVLTVQAFRLPKSPVRIGTANPGSWKFEFLMPAPPKPQRGEVAKDR